MLIKDFRLYSDSDGGGGLPPAGDPPAPKPAGDPPAPGGGDDKEHNRSGYEIRQLQKRLDEQQQELAKFRQRDEDARKAKLTEEQRLAEEKQALERERQEFTRDRLRTKIATEFKLPDELAGRLHGDDEDALRADAEKLAALLPKAKVGAPTDPLQSQGTGSGPKTFKTSQLRDHAFFKANEKAIMEAYRAGRIEVDD